MQLCTQTIVVYIFTFWLNLLLLFFKSYFMAKIKDVIYDFYMNINNDKLHF